MTRAADIRRARELAREVGATFPQVHSIFLVGSRAHGTPGPDEDFDLIAVVTDSSRRRGWRTAARPPYKGFPTSLDGLPVEWCLLRASEADDDEEMRGAVPLWRRQPGATDRSK